MKSDTIETVLLVLPDEDLESQIRDVLEEKLSPAEVRPILVKNERDALLHQGSNPRLVISSLNIPADRKSPLNPKEYRGLKLLEAFKAQKLEVPYIILSSSIKSDQFAKVTAYPACGVVILDGKEQDRQEGLRSTLDRVLRGSKDYREAIIEILFGFTGPELAQYRVMTVQGSAAVPIQQGTLRIDAGLLNKLAKETSKLCQLEYPIWRNKLSEIGEHLTDELLADHTFNKSFSAAVQAAGGLESTRIRFVIERDCHPVALEALLEPRCPAAAFEEKEMAASNANPDSRFWMLKAPMTRKLSVPGRVGPLFEDDETRLTPINCLIIEADVEGRWVPKAGILPRLRNVRSEAVLLKRYLQNEMRRPGSRVAQVKRIGRKTLPSGTSFRLHVEETLKGNTVWHLVHYAGHSYYDEKSKEGSVFFPGAALGGDSGQGVERVAIDEFAMWLDRTQFVYLSSCRNSEDNVGFDLARHGVPALISFRWDIEDEKASKYACTFYKALLKGPPSLERAFMEARHQMYKQCPENRIWAAPMLIFQT